MTSGRRRMMLGLALLPVTLLVGCQGCTPNPNVSKTVWIKYAHIANVFRINSNGSWYSGVNSQSFWAVFEICSIDVQGSALTGFNYSTGKFVIPWGTAEIGKNSPGLVSRTDGTAYPMPNYTVANVVNSALESGPSTQYLPKQLYLKPGFRFAIFVNAYPTGYLGEAMDLKYLGQPEVAAVMQNVQQLKPREVQYFTDNASAGITSYCP